MSAAGFAVAVAFISVASDAEARKAAQTTSLRLKGKTLRLPLTDGETVTGKYVSHNWTSVHVQPIGTGDDSKTIEVPWDRVSSNVAYRMLKSTIEPRAAGDQLRLAEYLLRRGKAEEADAKFRLVERLDRDLKKKVQAIRDAEDARITWRADPTAGPAGRPPPGDPNRPYDVNPLDWRAKEVKPKRNLGRGIRFETIRQAGRRGNRIDIVCVGDGYKGSGSNKRFSNAVEDLTNAFRKTPPFNEYYGLFNFHVVHVDRRTHEDERTGRGKVSALGVSRSRRDMVTSDPRVVSELVARSGVVADLLCVIVRKDRGGTATTFHGPGQSSRGGGYMNVGDSSRMRVYVHEAGHALGGLGDEYESWPFPGDPPPLSGADRRPNVTTSSSRKDCKWRHWFDEKGVGLYRGAMHHHKGVYRPCRNCIMRSSATSRFCPVCREALVLSFLERVRLIDRVEPPGNVVDTFACRDNTFRIRTIPLDSRSLRVKWTFDGNGIEPTSNRKPREVTFPDGTLTPGEHVVTVAVEHRTRYVRKDPKGRTRDKFTWYVTVSD